jgi:hypothetical protein
MTFNPLRSPVDYIVLSGKQSPGIATLAGWEDVRKWDERRGYAMSGANLLYRGRPLARGTVSFYFTTDADFDAWRTFKTLLQPPPPMTISTTGLFPVVRARVLSIVHPQLDEINVHRVVIEKVAQPTQDDSGGWTVVVSMIEWNPPARALSRPTAPAAAPALTGIDRDLNNATTQTQNLRREIDEG